MARPPDTKRLLWALLLILATACVTLAATFMINRVGPSGKVGDTPVRTKLLSLKSSGTPNIGDSNVLVSADKSVLYSSNVYDIEIGSDFSGRLPWASQVAPDPGGAFLFTWRIKLSAGATFSVSVEEAGIAPFSIRLYEVSGAPVFTKARGLTIPGEEVRLDPGIYVLDAAADRPLDFFRVSFKTDSAPTSSPFVLKSIRVKIDAVALRDFHRLVDVSLNSTGNDIVKMAGGRVKASIVDGTGQKMADARIGLSGRTREHLDWFPSVDLKLDGGTFMGIPSFKLYRLKTKSRLLDLTFLSLFKDMGFMIPRQDIVRFFINGEYMGLYILMETPSPAMFAAQKLPEANVIGVNAKKMFFDYPYGATLDERYFYRLKGPHSKKRGRRFFLSSDFTSRIERDSFARFLAFSSIYHSAHGLGVDDLRFYENPVTGLFQPLPRDLNPGIWPGFIVRTYLTHLGWLQGPPLYTVWPFKQPLKHDYRFDRSKNLFDNVSELNFATAVTDIHFSVSGFVADAGNLELTNRYLRHFLKNRAMMQKTAARVRNTLVGVLKKEPASDLLVSQLRRLKKEGIPFFDEFLEDNLAESGPYLADSKSTFFWNLRTSTSLRKDLMPSLLAPIRYEVDEAGWQNQLALAFLSEKKIFEILGKAGVELPRKTFTTSVEAAGEAISLAPYAYTGTRNEAADKAGDQAAMDVATYLGTHRLGADRALLILLVRNATEGVEDYKVVMRDGLTSYPPAVNTLFRLDGGMAEPLAPVQKKSTAMQIMLNHFSWGESLRLLAFQLPLGRNAEFYSVSMPEGSWFLFPPYMYLPARSSTVTEERGPVLPRGIIETSNGYLIPDGQRVEIKEDLLLSDGAELRIGAGAVVTMRPGSSLRVRGDLIVKGTREARVRFVSQDGQPWNGIFAGGSPSRNIEVVLENVDFADYGAFPKTRVGERYLNGGITLYNADVFIDGVRITGARGEDALNLISSTARIKDTEIRGASSDAIDLDFCTASVEGLLIEGAGGDALDVSASLVNVRASSFIGAADKGISVGEMSSVFVRDSSFIGNDMGIANKDQSRLEVSGSTFDNNRIALAEFIKKTYFAKPTSEANNNSYKDNEKDYAWLGFQRY